jgi:glycerate 2-kinase
MTGQRRRSIVRTWLDDALVAIDPESLTREALAGPPGTVIAIGKAAAAMTRGAHQAGAINAGVCVTNASARVPDGVDLLVGDHPVPASASMEAGTEVLKIARSAEGRLIALISGGGSSLCELPRTGIDMAFLQDVNRRLLISGATIEETNLVRAHLSAIKCGGVAREASVPIKTLVISDVGDAGPEVVASGPTLPMDFDPARAISTMKRYDIALSSEIRDVVNASRGHVVTGQVEVLADGMTAADAVATAAETVGIAARVNDDWISGDLEDELIDFLDTSEPGATVAAGEPTLSVGGDGVGGRNAHAALIAAIHLAGTDNVFAAFATDGVDGVSSTAGAIVDGSTVESGGDPSRALKSFDSATYLETIGHHIKTGPTGTNVADLWVIWRP